MLPGLLGEAEDHRIGLGETFETLDELGQLLGILRFDGDADDRRHAELHHFHVVGGFVSRDGSGLNQVVVDSDEPADVAAGDARNGLDGSAHHEDRSLDALDVEIFLFAEDEVGAHDAHLLASLDGARENATESVEATYEVFNKTSLTNGVKSLPVSSTSGE